MRVDRQRLLEVGSCGIGASEQPFDHRPVEVEQRAARAQPERLVGVADRLGVAAVDVELPRQRVGDEHALAPRVLGARSAQACRQVHTVVGAVEGDLQVDVDAIGAEQAFFGVEERGLLDGQVAVARQLVEVAQLGHVLRRG